MLSLLRLLARHPIRVASCLLLAASVSCGKDGTAPPSDGSGPGTTIQPAALLAALDEIDKVIETLPQTSVAEHAEALVAYLKSRPDVEDARLSLEGTLWARFTGGQPVVFAYEPELAAPSTTQGVDSATRQLLARRASLTNASASDPAYVINVLAEDSRTPTTSPVMIARWLAANGYSVAGGTVLEGTIADFASVKDAAVVYIATHGVLYHEGLYLKTADPVRVTDTHFVATPRGASNVPPPDSDEFALFLLLTMKPLGKPHVKETVWAVNANFVKKHWVLRPNSLVFADACVTFSSDAVAVSFIQAVFDAGAGSYLGWSAPVDNRFADKASAYFFDRVLGANEFQPEPAPPLRPFDFASVYKWMEEKDLIIDQLRGPSPLNAVLRLESRSKTDILRPYIYGVAPDEDVDEGGDLLVVVGEFGDEPGTVTIDDGSGPVALVVRSWTTELIVAALPRMGTAWVGDVVVTVREHTSNPRRLSSWRLPVTYKSVGPGSLTLTVEMDVIARFDPFIMRVTPGEAPKPYGAPVFSQHAASSAQYTATGTATIPSFGSCVVDLSWSGSGTLPFKGDGKRFYYWGTLDVPNLKVALRPTVWDFEGGITETRVTRCPNAAPETETAHWPVSLHSGVYDDHVSSLGRIFLELDERMNVRARQRSVDGLGPNYLPATVTIGWPALSAVPPYDPNQAK